MQSPNICAGKTALQGCALRKCAVSSGWTSASPCFGRTQCSYYWTLHLDMEATWSLLEHIPCVQHGAKQVSAQTNPSDTILVLLLQMRSTRIRVGKQFAQSDTARNRKRLLTTTPKGFWKLARVSEKHGKTGRITNLADIKYIRWPLISKMPL